MMNVLSHLAATLLVLVATATSAVTATSVGVQRNLTATESAYIAPSRYLKRDKQTKKSDNEVWAELVQASATFEASFVAGQYRAADGCVNGKNDNQQQVDTCLASEQEDSVPVNCCSGELGRNLKCSRPGCVKVRTFVEAEQHCKNEGMRLCSFAEMDSGACCNKGCGFNDRIGWTSSSCGPPPPPPPPTSNPTPKTSAPTALPSQSPTTSSPTNLPTPFPTTASPTPAPSTTELTPAPTTASQTPAPTTASSTPVSTTASPTPVPTTASPTPLPITASPTPLPMTATPTSLPTTATPTPLPTQREQLKIMGCGNNGDWKTKDGCAYPLLECTGDCDTNNDCAGDLICHQREPYEAVPGCSGGEQHDSKTDFCVRPSGGDGVTRDAGGDGPSPPTYAPNSFGATYVPGDLSQPCDGGKVMLSKGMDCRLLTTAGRPVQYDTGGQSSEVMHARADGAAVIPHPTDGGWYYTSNSEVGSGGGGVGTLRFNALGEVIGYKMDLQNTSDNCGGGKTYWNTWVTCEEDGSRGFCWEVDPFTGHTAKTNAVIVGGNYESFAYDDQDPDVEARFFTTEDSGNGALVRYTPSAAAFNTGDKYDILTSDGGTHEYLVLNADGTFDWRSNLSAGESSASKYFPNAEGIDVINRQLFFVSKVKRELFELDLAAKTWTSSSTVSGAFDKQPDQIQKIVGDTNFLYFCEDGGSSCDIHGRNTNGDFFTIVRGDGYATETTGLAFSPDNKFMYVAFQGNSNIYAFWRTDGLSFDAVKADIKYHDA